MTRLELDPENQFEETIKYLLNAVQELKTKQSLVGETTIQTTPQWTGSWTQLSSYQDVVGSHCLVNFDDWVNYNWYFEVIGFTNAGTGFFRLFNETDGVPVPDSEISTVIQGQANAVRLRSAQLAKYDGQKSFKVQIKIVGGDGVNDYVNCVMSRMVFKIET